ncbi:hypothetical protein LJC45_01495 [Alistipes sp. OttesenSCG-928-B03]|nr:hypothetical protein [Alistipes sp. OttesenSCG-928-B03]
MKRLFIIVFIALIGGCSERPKDDAPKVYIEDFFAVYKNTGANEALDAIFATNPLIGNNLDQVAAVKQKLQEDTKTLGRFCCYDIISSPSIGARLITYSCLVCYEASPLKFNFAFYKADDQWKLFNFKYESNLIDELDESARFFYIH